MGAGQVVSQLQAFVTTVEAGSPAANAGVQPGDEIVAVAGQPLVASKGEEASQLLFGKSGDRLQVTVHRGQQDPTLELVLGSKSK